jgi:uncharacterized protein DUF3617
MKKIFLVAALFGSTVAFAKGPQKAGNWHMTVTTEMPGMPAAQVPPQSVDTCVTPAQSDDPKQALKEHNKDCDPSDVKVVGNTITYKTTCHKHGGTQTGEGEIVYSGDSYTGTMTVEMDNPRGGGKMKIIQHVVGNRTGDCTK